MTQVLQPSRQAAWVTLISPSAAGNAGAGSLRGRAVRPGWADCWILLRQPASAWAFQEMQNRRGGRGGGGGGGAAAGGQLPGVDPVVDDAGAAVQLPGGLSHGDLAGTVWIRDRDLAGVADPLDRIDVERPAVAGEVPGGIQPGDQLVVAGARPEPLDKLDGGGRGAPGGAGVDGPGGGELVGGAGVPADPDPYFAAVRFGQQGDVGDQGAQQPLAVLGGGGAGVPEGG